MGHGATAPDLGDLTPARTPGTVEVEVHLFANLADYGPPSIRGGVARVELPDGGTLRDLLRRLRIPDEVPRLLFVNGHDAEPTARIGPGDVVDVLPPLVGG